MVYYFYRRIIEFVFDTPLVLSIEFCRYFLADGLLFPFF